MAVDYGAPQQPTPQMPPTPAPVAPDGGRPAAVPAPAHRPHPEGGVKDTVESILVAFILAFVFRAFVVEAFVIPTGSMAPTLLGAHMRFTCADCGYRYTVNYPTNPDQSIPTKARRTDPGLPAIAQPVHCPNCGYAVPAASTTGEDSREQPPVHYGDRILVLKYRYLLSDPQRWDVVVFKAPDNVQNAPRYTTNYIKRLIGRPGESIMMLDGDIYASTAPPPDDPGDRAARDAFLRTFRVQTKPGYAQEALWRNVYDNDYIPHGQRSIDPWRQPWTAAGGGGWDAGQNLPGPQAGRTREFRFDNPAGDGRLAFDPTANAETFPLTDYLAYDQLRDAGQRIVARNVVGDLRLSCFYTRQFGDGPFALTLSKRDDVFEARLTPGKAEIVWRKTDGRVVETFGPADVPELGGPAPARLDLANVDFRVALRVNGREVLTSGERYFPTGGQVVDLERAERQRNGQPDARLPRAELSAGRQRCLVEHVQLARDVFYLNNQNAGPMSGQLVNGNPDRPMVLGPDEYFVMGDNAPISGDARVWTLPVELPGEGLPYVAAGRVPARFMLGKAFFVYWPAGHRPLNGQLDFGLVPNFGEMRFIH